MIGGGSSDHTSDRHFFISNTLYIRRSLLRVRDNSVVFCWSGFVMSVLRNLPPHPSLFMQTRREIQDENDDSDFWGSISLRRGFYR